MYVRTVPSTAKNGFGISKTDLEVALIKVKAENLNTNA